MKLPLPTALFGLFLCFVVRSVAQDVAPINPQELLAALETLEKTEKESRVTGFGSIIKSLNTAAASPSAAMDFYEQAVMSTEFKGRTRENSIFQDWKRKNADKLKDKCFQLSLQLRLRYLALTLRHVAGDKNEAIVADLIPYTADVLTVENQYGLHPEWMSGKTPINSGLFVDTLNLQGRMSDLKDWEVNPGNVNGIFGKVILPALRKAKDPRVLVYWDRCIQLGDAHSDASGKSSEAGRFDTFIKPQLLWQRAKEYRNLDQPNRALQEMFLVVKTYPFHPDFQSWVGELRESVSKTALPPADNPQPSDTSPTPAETPPAA